VVTTTTIPQVTSKDIADRSERGLALFEERGSQIRALGEDLFEVPSCTGSRIYNVRYGGKVESCTCTDYGVHRGELSCKHLVAIGVLHASRRALPSEARSGIREVRTVHVAAGDPFKAASRRALPRHKEDKEDKAPHACYGGWVYIGHTSVNDDGEEAESLHAYPCKRCNG
jgi:hypothetical protein